MKLIEKGLPSKPSSSKIQAAEERAFNTIEQLLNSWNKNTGKRPVEIRNEMGETLNRNVGVYRNEKDLKEANQNLLLFRILVLLTCSLLLLNIRRRNLLLHLTGNQ